METVGVSLAIDIGGTFTDIVARKGRSVYVKKTLTTHENLLTGFMSGVAAVLEQAGAKAEDVTDGIFHATTVVTNALIERKGAATALVCGRPRDSRRAPLRHVRPADRIPETAGREG
jgi:N-methylhydantoinase A/oxoprolinase/acetone carboxylase beta subunit